MEKNIWKYLMWIAIIISIVICVIIIRGIVLVEKYPPQPPPPSFSQGEEIRFNEQFLAYEGNRVSANYVRALIREIDETKIIYEAKDIGDEGYIELIGIKTREETRSNKTYTVICHIGKEDGWISYIVIKENGNEDVNYDEEIAQVEEKYDKVVGRTDRRTKNTEKEQSTEKERVELSDLYEYSEEIMMVMFVPFISYIIITIYGVKSKNKNKYKTILILLIFIIIHILIFSVLVVARLAKPIIYIYPEEETEVTVELGRAENLTCTYPKYNNKWEVIADVDGTLTDKETGRKYYALYWEGISSKKYNKKLEEGFIVKGEDTIEFLEEKLRILGLNEREAEEFIVYWLPQMQNNKYNYIRFQTMEEIEENMPLNIEPKPETLIRVMMEWKGLNKKIEVKEQELQQVERKGYTVVEWGGTEIK